MTEPDVVGVTAACTAPTWGRARLLLAWLIASVLVVSCTVRNTASTTSVSVTPSSAQAAPPSGVPLPDARLTPGAAFPAVTTTQICAPGYTRRVRDVPAALKEAVFRRYAVRYPPPAGAFEVDHLIPLELGGSNDVVNLWPQPRRGSFGAAAKDHLENRLHAEVCAGRLDLAAAQRDIAANWYAEWVRAGRP